MPLVEIYLWKEKASEEKKEKLIKKVSEIVSEVTEAPLEAVEVLITEIPMANWGKGGIQATRWKR